MKTSRKLDQEVESYLRADDIQAAAARVIDVCGPAILGYLRVALASEEAAKQAFAVFSAAVRQQLRGRRDSCTSRVWAFRLAFQAAKRQRRGPGPTRINHHRSREVRQRALTWSAEPMLLAEHAALLRRDLSLNEQTLLTLRLHKQFSWAELAVVLGVPGGSGSAALMQRRFDKVVARLRRLAAAHGIVARDASSGRRRALHLVERSGTHDA